jgi:hypothetical protein
MATPSRAAKGFVTQRCGRDRQATAPPSAAITPSRGLIARAHHDL